MLTPGEPFDRKGAVLYCIVIFLLLYGLIRLPSTIGIIFLIFGIIFLILFVTFELREENPVFAIQLFAGNWAFTLANLVTMINYGATYAVNFFMSLYLQVIGVLTPAEAGLVMISMPIMQMIFSPISGRLSDRINARLLMTAGMLITTLGMLFLLCISEEYYQTWIILSLGIIGLGVAFFGAPNLNLVLSSVSRKDGGSANSINATMRQIGMVASMALATSFIALSFGSTGELYANHESLVSAMRLTFGCGTVLCLFGAIISWFAKNESNQKEKIWIKRG